MTRQTRRKSQFQAQAKLHKGQQSYNNGQAMDSSRFWTKKQPANVVFTDFLIMEHTGFEGIGVAFASFRHV